MRKFLNLKWDKRTAWNICKVLFIVMLRIFIVFFFWNVYWLNERSGTVLDNLSGWDSYD